MLDRLPISAFSDAKLTINNTSVMVVGGVLTQGTNSATIESIDTGSGTVTIDVAQPWSTSTTVTYIPPRRVTFAWDLNEKPTEVRVAQLTKQRGAAPSAAYTHAWTYGSNGITVTFFGLSPATNYVATIIAQV
jgi:hypothetical protein